MADVQRFGFVHINTNGTTNVSAGPCVLGGVQLNTKGAGSNTLTLQDVRPAGWGGSPGNPASTQVIAVIDTTNTPQWLQYGVAIYGVLQAIMATGTAADVTITFQD